MHNTNLNLNLHNSHTIVDATTKPKQKKLEFDGNLWGIWMENGNKNLRGICKTATKKCQNEKWKKPQNPQKFGYFLIINKKKSIFPFDCGEIGLGMLLTGFIRFNIFNILKK